MTQLPAAIIGMIILGYLVCLFCLIRREKTNKPSPIILHRFFREAFSSGFYPPPVQPSYRPANRHFPRSLAMKPKYRFFRCSPLVREIRFRLLARWYLEEISPWKRPKKSRSAVS